MAPFAGETARIFHQKRSLLSSPSCARARPYPSSPFYVARSPQFYVESLFLFRRTFYYARRRLSVSRLTSDVLEEPEGVCVLVPEELPHDDVGEGADEVHEAPVGGVVEPVVPRGGVVALKLARRRVAKDDDLRVRESREVRLVACHATDYGGRAQSSEMRPGPPEARCENGPR